MGFILHNLQVIADLSRCNSPSSSLVLANTPAASKLNSGFKGMTAPAELGASVKLRGAACSGSTSVYIGGGEFILWWSKLAALHSELSELMYVSDCAELLLTDGPGSDLVLGI